jgi:hypothetical protein
MLLSSSAAHGARGSTANAEKCKTCRWCVRACVLNNKELSTEWGPTQELPPPPGDDRAPPEHGKNTARSPPTKAVSHPTQKAHPFPLPAPKELRRSQAGAGRARPKRRKYGSEKGEGAAGVEVFRM